MSDCERLEADGVEKDLEVVRGTDLCYDAQYFEADGVTPRSLVGASFVGSAAQKFESDAAVDVTFTILDEASGTFRIFIARADVLEMTASEYRYDSRITEAGEKSRRFMYGRIIVLPQVKRNG